MLFAYVYEGIWTALLHYLKRNIANQQLSDSVMDVMSIHSPLSPFRVSGKFRAAASPNLQCSSADLSRAMSVAVGT